MARADGANLLSMSRHPFFWHARSTPSITTSHDVATQSLRLAQAKIIARLHRLEALVEFRKLAKSLEVFWSNEGSQHPVWLFHNHLGLGVKAKMEMQPCFAGSANAVGN